MSRGQLQFRNPAEAIAASKCWLNTWGRRAQSALTAKAVEAHGDGQYTYCSYPRDMLIQALEEFKDWSFISVEADEETPLRLEVEQFLALPEVEQQRLVRKAQMAEEDSGGWT